MDSGNSNINEEEQLELVQILLKINSKTLNKTLSADYIGVCNSTFDNYIRKGIIPKGKRERGSKELRWNKYDLDKYLNNEL